MSKVEVANGVSSATEHKVQQITTRTDSREILANAHRDIARLHLDDYFIVDVDAHHVEFDSWSEILNHLENPVLRHNAISMTQNWPNAKQLAFSNHPVGLTFQDVFGRIPHQAELGEHVEKTDEHRDLTLVRRAMDSMGIKMQVVFPQPMLEMGLHPEPDIVTAMTFAYNRWFTRTILPREKRVKTLLCLPFHDPEASLKMIKEFGETPGVVGFMITSQRHAGVHKNMFMRIYRELEERGLPLAFHAGPTWGDTMTSTMNRFLSVHSMSFVTCNMMHMTNWIVNGLARAFSETESDLDRKRAGLGSVHDAAARSRIPDAAVGCSAAEEIAERIHSGDVFYVATTGGDDAAHARSDIQGRACGHAADVLLRLASLGFRCAGAHRGAAVSGRAGQAQYSGRKRAEAVSTVRSEGTSAAEAVLILGRLCRG